MLMQYADDIEAIITLDIEDKVLEAIDYRAA